MVWCTIIVYYDYYPSPFVFKVFGGPAWRSCHEKMKQQCEIRFTNTIIQYCNGPLCSRRHYILLSFIIIYVFNYVLIMFLFFKKNLNASRPSEHPSIRGENVKTFRWDHRLQTQICLVFGWCPCMAINVSVQQHNGGFLPDIMLLTQCYYHHRGTCLKAMKRFCFGFVFVAYEIPPKRFTFWPGCSEGLDAFGFLSKLQILRNRFRILRSLMSCLKKSLLSCIVLYGHYTYRASRVVV